MALKEEKKSLLKTLGYGAIEEASRRYPDATRASGHYFYLAVKAGITHARTKMEALDALLQAIGGGVEAGKRPAGLAGFTAGKTQRADKDGWRFYDDGTIVVPIFDGTPGKAKKAFSDILTMNVAFGGYKVTGYAEDANGDLKHPRFTKEEVAASKGTEHGQLWHYILSLESSDVHGGGTEALGRGKGGADSQGGGRLGHLRRLATRYGSDPRAEFGESLNTLTGTVNVASTARTMRTASRL